MGSGCQISQRLGSGQGSSRRRLGRVVAALLLCASLPTLAAPAPARQQELSHLVRQDCGSCHGLTLQGGLGSALTPQALRDKDRDGLVATVLYGRPGSAMPPWKDFVSEDEARWIIEALQAGQLR